MLKSLQGSQCRTIDLLRDVTPYAVGSMVIAATFGRSSEARTLLCAETVSSAITYPVTTKPAHSTTSRWAYQDTADQSIRPQAL